MEKVLLSGILEQSLGNGKGLRKVIFSQICYHNCKGCFNPHTHSKEDGTWFSIQDIIEKINNDPIIEGVTFSGGDPFEQAEAFAVIAKSIRKDLNIWCYTGYTLEYILEHQEERLGWKELIESIDVLVDGKFEEDHYDPNLRYRGSSNQRLLDVKKSIEQNQAVLLV